MQQNTRLWIHSAASVAISSFSSGLILLVADPQKFNLAEGLRPLLLTSLLFSAIGLANFLKTKPLPDADAQHSQSVTTLDLTGK